MLTSDTRSPRVTSVPAPSEGKPKAFVISNAPEPLDKDDYSDVRYWHDKNWFKYTERQKDRGELVSRLDFLTDRDDNLISELRIKIFTSTAKQA